MSDTEQRKKQTAREKRRAGLPPAPKAEAQQKPSDVCAVLNLNNPLKIPWPGITFLYQIDSASKHAKDEELILEHNEYDWEHRIKLRDMKVVSDDWVRLLFKCGPRSGTYNLLQDPKDDQELFFVFREMPFESLTVVLPECEEGETPVEESEESNRSEPTQTN